jgi:hypothetical protein
MKMEQIIKRLEREKLISDFIADIMGISASTLCGNTERVDEILDIAIELVETAVQCRLPLIKASVKLELYGDEFFYHIIKEESEKIRDEHIRGKR